MFTEELLSPSSVVKVYYYIIWFTCVLIITCQAMLMILDSTLNKAGKLKALYVRTEKGVLFEVKPHVRIPRTYKRFSGIICKFNCQPLSITSGNVVYILLWILTCLMTNAVQLLQKLSISAVGKREKLLRVVKNPVTQYLPVNSRRIGKQSLLLFF